MASGLVWVCPNRIKAQVLEGSVALPGQSIPGPAASTHGRRPPRLLLGRLPGHGPGTRAGHRPPQGHRGHGLPLGNSYLVVVTVPAVLLDLAALVRLSVLAMLAVVWSPAAVL